MVVLMVPAVTRLDQAQDAMPQEQYAGILISTEISKQQPLPAAIMLPQAAPPQTPADCGGAA